MSAPCPAPSADAPVPRFPRAFWSANATELLERAAYYSVASFMVVYLNENLGMDPTLSTFLNGSILWGLLYFLPILSGTVADQVGFRRSLLFAMAVLGAGYLTLGRIGSWWAPVATAAGLDPKDYTLPVILGISLVGLGGSIVKPCISGTVQKTAADRATLGFAIFYMVINIGSMFGRLASYFVRVEWGIPAVFVTVAAPFALAGFALVAVLYPEPAAGTAPRRTLAEALRGMVAVLGNLRFVAFLLVVAGFWAMYVQLYNLIPLFLRRFIDPEAPVELYTLANPVMIVLFQVLVTRLSARLRPVPSIALGMLVASAGMALNAIPLAFLQDAPALFGGRLPLAGLFMIASIAFVAMGEMLAAPRMYEFIGAVAPKGREGLFLGYASLPTAVGTIVGAPLGGWLFQSVAVDAGRPAETWLVVSGMGLVSMAAILLYDRVLARR